MQRLHKKFVLAGLMGLLSVAASAQPTTSDAIRDAQTNAATVGTVLRFQADALPSISAAMNRIDGLSREKSALPTSLQSAKEFAQAAQASVTKLLADSNTARAELRQLESKLDSALASVETARNEQTPLKKIDEALTPTVATSLAAACLTLAGLLLGLGMPLLLSTLALPGAGAGAAEFRDDFRVQVARAGVFALKAFAFFAIAILENLTLDPNDAAIFSTLETSVRLWLDVGINGGALIVGLWLLLRAAKGLADHTDQLIKVWNVVKGT